MSDLVTRSIQTARARFPRKFNKSPCVVLDEAGLDEEAMPEWYKHLGEWHQRRAAPVLVWLLHEIRPIFDALGPHLDSVLSASLPPPEEPPPPAVGGHEVPGFAHYVSRYNTPAVLIWAIARRWVEIAGGEPPFAAPAYPGATQLGPKASLFEELISFPAPLTALLVGRDPVRFAQAVRQALAWLDKAMRRPPGGRQGHLGHERRRVKESGKLRHWTQGELDKAIAEYKAKRGARYGELVTTLSDPQMTPKARRAAKKTARQLFGRNAIARALDCRTPGMVSRSPEWLVIAEALGFNLRRKQLTGTRHTAKRGRVGFEHAIEGKSRNPANGAENEPPDAGMLKAEKGETYREIRRLATSGRTPAQKDERRRDAADLKAKYDRGEMTDEQVRETVRLVMEPNAE